MSFVCEPLTHAHTENNFQRIYHMLYTSQNDEWNEWLTVFEHWFSAWVLSAVKYIWAFTDLPGICTFWGTMYVDFTSIGQCGFWWTTFTRRCTANDGKVVLKCHTSEPLGQISLWLRVIHTYVALRITTLLYEIHSPSFTFVLQANSTQKRPNEN